MQKINSRGFIALVSIIILSSVLTIFIAVLSAYSISLQANAATRSHEYQSFEDAASCAALSLQKIPENTLSLQATTIFLKPSASCVIESISTVQNITTIITSATSSFHTFVRLETIVDPETLEIRSQREL